MDDRIDMVAQEQEAALMWSIALGAAVVWLVIFYAWRRKHRPVPVTEPEIAPTPPPEPSRPEPTSAPTQPVMVMMSAPARVARRRILTVRGLWNFVQDLVEWAVFAGLVALLVWVLGEIVLHHLFPSLDHNAIAQFLSRAARRESHWVAGRK